MTAKAEHKTKLVGSTPQARRQVADPVLRGGYGNLQEDQIRCKHIPFDEPKSQDMVMVLVGVNIIRTVQLGMIQSRIELLAAKKYRA